MSAGRRRRPDGRRRHGRARRHRHPGQQRRALGADARRRATSRPWPTTTRSSTPTPGALPDAAGRGPFDDRAGRRPHREHQHLLRPAAPAGRLHRDQPSLHRPLRRLEVGAQRVHPGVGAGPTPLRHPRERAGHGRHRHPDAPHPFDPGPGTAGEVVATWMRPSSRPSCCSSCLPRGPMAARARPSARGSAPRRTPASPPAGRADRVRWPWQSTPNPPGRSPAGRPARGRRSPAGPAGGQRRRARGLQRLPVPPRRRLSRGAAGRRVHGRRGPGGDQLPARHDGRPAVRRRAAIKPLYDDHTRAAPAMQGGHHASNIAVNVAPDRSSAQLSAYF